MDTYSLILIGLGLSMDAFAVTMANTLCYSNMKKSYIFLMAIIFGIFQGIMPLIGYFAGNFFIDYISAIDHWIALILLSIIGIQMIKEAYDDMNSEDGIVCPTKPLSMKLLFVQAIATSIDALTIGISFSALHVKILNAALLITLITFSICLLGGLIGKTSGKFLKSKSELLGGVILIIIGIRIFVEHMFL